MNDQRTATKRRSDEWVYVCDRCGERMQEIKCKIICGACGYCRDCSDP
jgi:hypothetical protein